MKLILPNRAACRSISLAFPVQAELVEALPDPCQIASGTRVAEALALRAGPAYDATARRAILLWLIGTG
jgi:hypothetical protein